MEMSSSTRSPIRIPAHRLTLALAAALTLLGFGLLAPLAEAASMSPSRSGLLRQVRAARDHGYTYLKNDADVRRFVRQGYLVPLPGNSDYLVKHSVRQPYARPEVKLFIERLGAQYRGACGEQLVVTSLVRPKSRQPRNSSPLSVHPTGMAMDLRVSANARCQRWLESALLGLEENGVLEAARERHPAHYHVVLFPNSYIRYVGKRTGEPVLVAASGSDRAAELASYRVRRGDSLWSIARSHGTNVRTIQATNGLRSTRIKANQVLKVPVVAR